MVDDSVSIFRIRGGPDEVRASSCSRPSVDCILHSDEHDGTDRAHWAGDSDANAGLPSPPAMGGGDDQSFFSNSQLPATGEGEKFVPSKMGYLHIKNQVL